MNQQDQRILNALQFAFPLTTRPFLSIGKAVGCDETAVLARVAALKKDGIIRQISAIFDSASIGYRSTLIAFRVPARRIVEVADAISAHAGVSHNYQRKGRYNLWFTLTLPAGDDLREAAGNLAQANRIADWLFLPALHTYKIRFQLDLTGAESAAVPVRRPVHRPKGRSPRVSRAFIRELQKDLPVDARPFRRAAQALGITEREVVARVKNHVRTGAIRRMAAVLRQTRAGFAANVMVAWAPAPGRKERLASSAAAQPRVSHCYERPVHPTWPFSLYTMIHGRDMAECQQTIEEISQQSGVRRYRALETVREFKKVRVAYYS